MYLVVSKIEYPLEIHLQYTDHIDFNQKSKRYLYDSLFIWAKKIHKAFYPFLVPILK